MLGETIDAGGWLAGRVEAPVVLVVERNDELRCLIRRILDDDGHFVLEARDAGEAAERLARNRVGLIVAECSEPGIGGPDGVRDRLAPEAWILRITSNGASDLLELPAERRTFVLTRAFRTDALRESARELLAIPRVLLRK